MTYSHVFVAFLTLSSIIHNGSTAATTQSIPHDDECFNKRDCSSYDIKSACCGIYESWARANCQRHCRFCTPKVTPAPVCNDTIPNCHEYNADLCINDRFTAFVESNCAGYCKLCEKPLFLPVCARNGTSVTGHTSGSATSTLQQTTASTTPLPSTITSRTTVTTKVISTSSLPTTTSTTVSPLHTGNIKMCFHDGHFHSKGDGWYTEHCLHWCECVDPLTNQVNCGPKKCPNWTLGCDLIFHQGHCCPVLKCPASNQNNIPVIG